MLQGALEGTDGGEAEQGAAEEINSIRKIAGGNVLVSLVDVESLKELGGLLFELGTSVCFVMNLGSLRNWLSHGRDGDIVLLLSIGVGLHIGSDSCVLLNLGLSILFLVVLLLISSSF